MADQQLRRLARGAFADVFDGEDGTVIKAYRRTKHSHGRVVDWADHDFVTERMFAAEIRAYERVQAIADLRPYVPEFYGALKDIGPLPRSSTGEPFVPGCVLRLERIAGRDQKIANVEPPIQQEIEVVLESIRDNVGRSMSGIARASFRVREHLSPSSILRSGTI